MKKRFLAGLTSAQFLRRHWQKEPLFARDALAQYVDAVSREDLYTLAGRDDVEARIVMKRGAHWRIEHGPFDRRRFATLPRRGWTLLVQGVDQKVTQAARLLDEFSFIPYARLDDVMVSYAAPGGGVGPHFDSYDVFLLQGIGERRWQVSRQRDLALVPDIPVKILERFEPQQEWRVRSGDLLYLPPQYAHDGVAIGECITYSVGFRAPAAQALAHQFLEFLQDGLELDGLYADPDLEPTRHPGRLPRQMIDHAAAVLERVRWSRRDVARFMGAHLTEPKNHVVFDPPANRASAKAFAREVGRRGVRLAPATRMLTSGVDVYINGERHRSPAGDAALFTALADTRSTQPPIAPGAESAALLYEWYLAGYIEICSAPRTAASG
jgi:50S ribosomal protein L16 3-hydroxylase